MLFITVIMLFLQNVIMKQYNKNVGGFRSLLRFNIIWALSVLVFFIVIAKGRYVFHLQTLLFSVVFALAYAAVILFQVLAIRNGPLSLSVLIISYSLVIPAIAGVVYLGEPMKIGGILGIGMLILSLLFTNFSKSKEPLKLRWFVYAFLALLGNGACTTVLKFQQDAFPQQFRNEFMINAMGIVILLGLTVIWLFPKEKQHTIRTDVHYAIAAGLCNAVCNLLVLLLATRMPASLMFPIVSAGGIVLTFVVSVGVYRERLSNTQTFGFVLGILSVVMLSL
jgi:drug/metabolite transporter (DMT)-like permease